MLVVFTEEAVGTYGFDGFAPTQVLELPVSIKRESKQQSVRQADQRIGYAYKLLPVY